MSAVADAPLAVDAEAIRAAARASRRTCAALPCSRSTARISGCAGVRLVFKLEFLQHAGSFKARGAFNQLLSRAVPAAGVVAASGGNHGAAVAYAAMRLGKPATIFVPSVASPAKMEQIRGYGARLEVAGERYDDALEASRRLRAGERCAGDPRLRPARDARRAGHRRRRARFPGAGPRCGPRRGRRRRPHRRHRRVVRRPRASDRRRAQAAPTLTRALEAGAPVDAPAGGIAADSLAPRRVGELVFPIARRYVERTALVSDAAIVEAQRLLWKTLRVVAEPGGATALAALTSGAWRPRAGQAIGVLLCGANTTAVRFD